MTKPLLAILLLLPLSVSAGDEARLLTDEEARAVLEELWRGELDGKAIICINEDQVTPYEWERGNPRGFEFESGGATGYWIRTKETSAVLSQSDDYQGYSVTINTVTWGNRYTLNRETLALQYRHVMNTFEVKYDYQCELADSPEAMLKTIEAARLETQRKIDEEMKDNKI